MKYFLFFMLISVNAAHGGQFEYYSKYPNEYFSNFGDNEQIEVHGFRCFIKRQSLIIDKENGNIKQISAMHINLNEYDINNIRIIEYEEGTSFLSLNFKEEYDQKHFQAGLTGRSIARSSLYSKGRKPNQISSNSATVMVAKAMGISSQLSIYSSDADRWVISIPPRPTFTLKTDKVPQFLEALKRQVREQCS